MVEIAKSKEFRPVYVGFSMQSDFVAFRQIDDDTLMVFSPGDLSQQYCKYDLRKLAQNKSSFIGHDDKSASYDETVNAAWWCSKVLNRDSCSISKMPPGKFYPRMWRGMYIANQLSYCNLINPVLMYGHKFTQSAVAATSLFEYLTEIFRYIEPSEANFGAFSHKIRELLILACTEIESGWRAVINENTRDNKQYYSTNDYIMLKEPLGLDKWILQLKDYPRVTPFTPFGGWVQEMPTKSLAWYDAYNAIKHDREADFQKATLGNLLNAMAGLHVMQAAQWGPEVYSRFRGNRFSPFYLDQWPIYPREQLYIPSLNGNENLEAAFYFDS